MLGLIGEEFDEKTNDFVESVNYHLSGYPEEKIKAAEEMFKEYGSWLNCRDLQKKLDEILGEKFEACIISHRACVLHDLRAYSRTGVEFYRWCACDCTAKGHKQMDGVVCRIGESDTAYDNDGNGNPLKKPRPEGAAMGTPADSKEFCRCSVSMFEPEIDW